MATAYPLDFKKWFDRFQPQTLQIATWLLYFRGFFAVIDLLGDRARPLRVFRAQHELLGWPVGLAVIAAFVGGGFLMANDRKLGYYLAIGAAFSPLALRVWLRIDVGASWTMANVLFGNDLIGFIFEVALIALLLHPQSKEHVRIYYR
jgi:hypothetical protein